MVDTPYSSGTTARNSCILRNPTRASVSERAIPQSLTGGGLISVENGTFINHLVFHQTMPLELTSANFQQEINAATPLIVDFWAEWCGPCRMVAPVFEELSKEYAGKLRFGKLDTEKYPNIAAENEISGIPCLIVFKNGQEVDRIIGFAPKPMLKQKIEAALAKA